MAGAGNRSRTFLGGFTAAAALLLAIAAPATAGTLDQQQTSENTNIALLSGQTPAQTFTAGISGVLDQVDLSLEQVGTPPASVTVEIRNTDNAGNPRTVLATASLPTSAIPTFPAFVPVTFASPALVAAGTQYAIVAYSPGTVTNYVAWSDQNSGNVYSGGGTFLSTEGPPPGSTWMAQAGSDQTFKTYVGLAPPSAAPPSAAPPSATPPSVKPTATCKGQQATLVGTAGNDAITGTARTDVIAALGGNDKVFGLAGNDAICGGLGKDTLRGGAGNDFLSGQKGNDKLYGQKGNDKLSGKAGKDTLKGGPGKDILKGGAGKDKQVQ